MAVMEAMAARVARVVMAERREQRPQDALRHNKGRQAREAGVETVAMAAMAEMAARLPSITPRKAPTPLLRRYMRSAMAARPVSKEQPANRDRERVEEAARDRGLQAQRAKKDHREL